MRFLPLSLCCSVFAGLSFSTVADLDPVVRDPVTGDFEIINNTPFNSSGLTMDVRRFAGPFPDDDFNGGRRPRLNAMSFAPGVEGLFVVSAGAAFDATADGKVLHVSPDGSTISEVLNVADFYTLPKDGDVFWQQGGLRSVTFHPEFSTPGTRGYGKLYTSQTVARPDDISSLNYVGPALPPLGGQDGNNPNPDRHDGSIVEWEATFNPNGSIVSINSPRELYRVATPTGNHPIKEAAFNPHAQPGDEDYGLLYVLHPDGINTSRNETGTGQNADDALGKIFRIDPLENGSSPYSIPSTNPFVGNDGQAPGGGNLFDEVYAIGFRDQHTISFANNENGADHILVSDIGSRFIEEINLIEKGGNYGWNEREGTFAVDLPLIGGGEDSLLDLPDGDDGYIYPVAQFGRRGSSAAVAGGYTVQNGSELDGYYFFMDFVRSSSPMLTVSLEDLVNAVTAGDNGDLAPAEVLTVNLLFDHDDDPLTPSIPKSHFKDILDDEASYDGSGRTDIRFGQGPDGELYLLNKRNGYIYLVTNSVAPVPEPTSLALMGIGVAALFSRRCRRDE